MWLVPGGIMQRMERLEACDYADDGMDVHGKLGCQDSDLRF